MSLVIEGSNTAATVEARINDQPSGASITADASNNQQGYIVFSTPISYPAGSNVNFKTLQVTDHQQTNSGRVSAWFRRKN